ncbi:MAG: hypothetical protein LC798_12095 [Chloroflexi bacterium]|nr:hypothetical protein [Chloroflexota bacterium]
MRTQQQTAVVMVTVRCTPCSEDWDVFMTPEQAAGVAEPDAEFVACPGCDERGEWDAPDA